MPWEGSNKQPGDRFTNIIQNMPWEGSNKQPGDRFTNIIQNMPWEGSNKQPGDHFTNILLTWELLAIFSSQVKLLLGKLRGRLKSVSLTIF